MDRIRGAVSGKGDNLARSASQRKRIAAIMRGNTKTDTRPELEVRRLLHSAGYRFRLYARDLPGVPDVVFRGKKSVILVHGCFWHQHESKSCPLSKHPKSNLSYWTRKLEGNRQRDRRTITTLRGLGWRVLVVWECETRRHTTLLRRLKTFLSHGRS
jgi:DNA mismatch endonuclease, patch repair protein